LAPFCSFGPKVWSKLVQNHDPQMTLAQTRSFATFHSHKFIVKVEFRFKNIAVVGSSLNDLKKWEFEKTAFRWLRLALASGNQLHG